ncbi:hypothetical protein MMC22_005810 [Lobaria immixta]|nr:hypothetical protein [Lobaria immixta]
MDVLWTFKNISTLTRPSLRNALQQPAQPSPAQSTNSYLRITTTSRSAEQMDNTIDLALRLWLTMDIQARQFGGIGNIQWNDDSSLGDFIEQRFRTAKKTTGEVAQVEIGAGILPDKLIDEMIKSLGILFLQDSRTATFMEQFHFKGRLGHDCPFLLPASTPYLQDRLAAMYFKLKGPPTTWRQRFHEDLAEWFSFWSAAVAITIMTFVFGSTSVGPAVWSATMAKQSLEIAREGLELARHAAASNAKSALSCTQAICSVPTSTAIVKLVKRF